MLPLKVVDFNFFSVSFHTLLPFLRYMFSHSMEAPLIFSHKRRPAMKNKRVTCEKALIPGEKFWASIAAHSLFFFWSPWLNNFRCFMLKPSRASQWSRDPNSHIRFLAVGNPHSRSTTTFASCGWSKPLKLNGLEKWITILTKRNATSTFRLATART